MALLHFLPLQASQAKLIFCTNLQCSTPYRLAETLGFQIALLIRIKQVAQILNTFKQTSCLSLLCSATLLSFSSQFSFSLAHQSFIALTDLPSTF